MFHMQDSGQYSMNTSGKFAAADIDERRVCKSCADSDIVKMEEQTIFGEKITENHFDS